MASPPQSPRSEASNPKNRIRWATRRETHQDGLRKRESLIKRWHHRKRPSEERPSTEAEPEPEHEHEPVEAPGTPEEEEPKSQRRVFFNIPLPDDARDEDGKPAAQYARNKIRTAKYTPLSFLPKNLWFQFHNVANIYFLFIIILGVSKLSGNLRWNVS